MYRSLSDREDVLRGGPPFLDIDEEMSWDAVAIYSEDSIGLLQGCFENRLRIMTG
ncbi:MAG: hypothetical protein RL042_2303 [Nitrospirota bacterium]